MNSVEKPGRYVGGEFGAITHLPEETDIRVCIVFPDLYEIGMSNQAVRILYQLFNRTDGIHAERAFSPAPDFARALRENSIPIYSLENGIPISDFDILAVTIGYELSFTNLLSFLESGDIPIRKQDRNNSHPLVIAGGPAITNPVPWADFIDAVFIGEAEEKVADDILLLRNLKDSGADRAELIRNISELKGYWTPDKPVTDRVVWNGFGSETGDPAALPIPSMIPVQDHGVIEIMRGCPNKCRFCHAGVFYRPFRQKSINRILEEAEFLVDKCGYRDITLSSLSTGDYVYLEPLVQQLNSIYSSRRVSFSLPSLRVNSITLSLIGNLGSVRKSGLTFAVETPTAEGQKGINKEVPADRVIEILREAKKEGWKLAKFYFMIGLPVENGDDEASSIIEYLTDIQKSTGINLNVNLGTFIPKPHTPFQRSAQLTDEQAITLIRKIKDGLRSNKRIRFTFHSPYVSYLEGILSRGDERAGELAYRAWQNGAGFDAWDDRMDRDAWRKAIKDTDWDVEKESCRERSENENLPWDDINLGITLKHLSVETERGRAGELTVPCAEICTDHCGVCGKQNQVRIPDNTLPDISALQSEKSANPDEIQWKRLLLTFSKEGPAIYLGHLDVMNVFERALQRTGFNIDFTRGFNPKPRIEFAQPLSLGISSEEEICTVRMACSDKDVKELIQILNRSLPSGIVVNEASWIRPVPEGKKTRKVMTAFWGSDWIIDVSNSESTASGLAELLRTEVEERGIPDDMETEISDENLKVRLRHGGTKHHNLMRLLESVIGKPPLQASLQITRIRSWATGANGSPVSFAAVFPS